MSPNRATPRAAIVADLIVRASARAIRPPAPPPRWRSFDEDVSRRILSKKCGSPASPLAEGLDHPRETRCGVSPVGVDGLLGAERIAVGDAADDDAVLLDRCRDLIDEAVDVQADVSLRLRLRRGVEREQPRSR